MWSHSDSCSDIWREVSQVSWSKTTQLIIKFFFSKGLEMINNKHTIRLFVLLSTGTIGVSFYGLSGNYGQLKETSSGYVYTFEYFLSFSFVITSNAVNHLSIATGIRTHQSSWEGKLWREKLSQVKSWAAEDFLCVCSVLSGDPYGSVFYLDLRKNVSHPHWQLMGIQLYLNTTSWLQRQVKTMKCNDKYDKYLRLTYVSEAWSFFSIGVGIIWRSFLIITEAPVHTSSIP